jgi:hypothetical protein
MIHGQQNIKFSSNLCNCTQSKVFIRFAGKITNKNYTKSKQPFPRIRVISDKLKLPFLVWKTRFITVFGVVCQISLTLARLIQFILSHACPVSSISILSSHMPHPSHSP